LKKQSVSGVPINNEGKSVQKKNLTKQQNELLQINATVHFVVYRCSLKNFDFIIF
jgi:hypothetical protein